MQNYYHYNEILPNVYRIGSMENVYEYLFVGKEKALLFDTGYGYGNLAETVRSITAKPLIIVNSHGHLDHVCGNFQFTEDIYISSKDMNLCIEHNSEEMRKSAVEGAKHTMDYQTGSIKNILPEGFQEENYIHQGTGKQVILNDGHIFELGDMTLVAHEFPGHTQGSMALEYLRESALFTGDAMNSFLWLFMPEATDLTTYKKSLLKAKELWINKIIFSHNEMIAGREILDDFIDCAEHVNYDKGVLFDGPMGQEFEPRICAREGYGPMEMMRPGYAALVISKPHLS